jgi:ferredoxin
VQGPAVLGYIYRGFASVVGPEFGERLEDTVCTTCGKCIEVCPTGALLPKTKNYKTNPSYFTYRDTRCSECGAACYISIQQEGDTVLRVDAKEGNDFNGLDLCYKGRFDWQNIDVQLSAEGLESLDVPDGTVMNISPAMSNEMIEAALAYAKDKGLEVVSCELTADPCEAYAERKDLDEAEALVLVGPLNQMIKAKARSLQLKGAKLIVVNDTDDRFNRLADADLSELSALEIEKDVKTLFIYNREELDMEAKKAIKAFIDKLDHATAWVNSSYLNTRGLESFDIETVDKLEAQNVILWGKTPDNCSADKVWRLPLKPFHVKGMVVSDFGEKIKL